MTEEEYFRKAHPDSCYGDRPLSPYWDFFQDGVDFSERQSEKKIAELKSDNDARKFAMAMSEKVEKQLQEQLTKVKALLKKMYYLYFEPCVTHTDLENRDKLFKEVKQFIKE